MNRDEARFLFKDEGLTYADLTPESLRRLRFLINEQMKASGCMQGTFRCRQRAKLQETTHGRFAELRCKADYFDDREAITFNTDGFIGFAGWADDKNIQPIITGFAAWVDETASAKEPS